LSARVAADLSLTELAGIGPDLNLERQSGQPDVLEKAWCGADFRPDSDLRVNTCLG
jgi:hypothetical protein